MEETGVAVNRDQRRMTVAATLLAGVVPAAGVKLVTCKATVCPRWMAAVFVWLAKKLRLPGETVFMGRPLVSTKKGLGAGMLTVNRLPMLRPPIRELEAAVEGLSVTMMPNCVRLVELMEVTIPSTMSCRVERSGSISWIERVPLELRMASTLATWFAETQPERVEGRWRRRSGFREWEK